MMTKKDYIAISGLIKKFIIGPEPESVFTVERVGPEPFIIGLCMYMERDNPNFNETKFLEACGIKE